jgi:hypothetical protein
MAGRGRDLRAASAYALRRQVPWDAAGSRNAGGQVARYQARPDICNTELQPVLEMQLLKGHLILSRSIDMQLFIFFLFFHYMFRLHAAIFRKRKKINSCISMDLLNIKC